MWTGCSIPRKPGPLHAGRLMMVGSANSLDVRTSDQARRFNGAIAKLEIFDQALTAAEVLAHDAVSISGTIVDAVTRAPIYNAIVQVGGAAGPTMVTDATGAYVLVKDAGAGVDIFADALGYHCTNLFVNGSGNVRKTIALTLEDERRCGRQRHLPVCHVSGSAHLPARPDRLRDL